MSLKTRTNEAMPLTGEEVISRYFKCIDNKDLDGILALFDYDAVVHEPFSKVEGLHGRSAIEPFLKVAMMANSTLRRTIIIEKPAKPNKVTALITFEKGDKVKAKFTFEFTNGNLNEKTIRSLHIRFL